MEDQIDINELNFRIREIQNQYNRIEIEIESLEIERDKVLLELRTLEPIYMNNVGKIMSEKLEAEQRDEVPEVKSKKLRKPNDKPSENNIEVQLKEGRS